MHTTSIAQDQIFNDGSSAPEVSSSLVEGGLSAGSVDSGGNIDGDAGFSDPVGEDAFPGTPDDDLSPTSLSAVVDAGTNALLPADRFDLDGDGDTSEPVPIDLAGRERVADGGSGAATVDLGAFEFAAMDIGRQRFADAPAGSFRLTAPYPNPATSTATITFLAGKASRARLVVYDLLGRQVMTAFDGSVSPGSEVEKPIDVSSLPAGVYMVRLTAGSQEMETRLTVAR